MELDTLTDALIEELGELYSARKRLVDASAKLAAASRSDDPHEALDSHSRETAAEQVTGAEGASAGP
jgi:ferritin-like metal-binding protein YciE